MRGRENWIYQYVALNFFGGHQKKKFPTMSHLIKNMLHL